MMVVSIRMVLGSTKKPVLITSMTPQLGIRKDRKRAHIAMHLTAGVEPD